MKISPLLFLALLSFAAVGQSSVDSVSLEEALNSVLVDSAAVDERDSTYANVQYTQAHQDLTVTKQEFEKKYEKESFNKNDWKKIVGDASYSEEAEQEKRNAALPNMAINPFVLQVLGYTVIFGLLAYLIYLFIRQAIKDPNRKITPGSPLFIDQTDPEHVADLDLENLLREALSQNNLRLAVRLYYIKLLKHLTREGFIRWEKNKTNRDYANELVSNGFSGQFQKIMVAYEYVWYGERTPSPEEFRQLESNFMALYQTQRS
jgi:Domain of unknown function (DUF4129)